MANELTVEEAVNKIRLGEFVIPSIQRNFVWDHDQIRVLFDSLLQEYPIGSFLFWRLDKEHVGKFPFYKFLDSWHEKDLYESPRIETAGDQNLTAVLDGQQRLTAFNIGLRGSYAFKTKKKRWDNPDAFPRRKLCLNLAREAQDDDFDMRFDFQFIPTSDVMLPGLENRWFQVQKILQMTPSDIDRYLAEEGLDHHFAREALTKLHYTVRERKSVHYLVEEEPNLEKVLNIFVRANSGGTPLTYSELLMSVATASWKTQDAREEIGALEKNLNSAAGEFTFDQDFILKSCLVLSNLDVAFKAKNFDRENVQHIEQNWKRISAALGTTVRLAVGMGFTGENLPTGVRPVSLDSP